MPPVEASYQFLAAPRDAVAPNATVPVPQREPGVVVVIAGIGSIEARTLVLAAVVHEPAVAST